MPTGCLIGHSSRRSGKPATWRRTRRKHAARKGNSCRTCRLGSTRANLTAGARGQVLRGKVEGGQGVRSCILHLVQRKGRGQEGTGRDGVKSGFLHAMPDEDAQREIGDVPRGRRGGQVSKARGPGLKDAGARSHIAHLSSRQYVSRREGVLEVGKLRDRCGLSLPARCRRVRLLALRRRGHRRRKPMAGAQEPDLPRL